TRAPTTAAPTTTTAPTTLSPTTTPAPTTTAFPTPIGGGTNPTCLDVQEFCSRISFSVGGGDYTYRDFNAISFNNWVANTGDVEGSLLVRRNFSAQAGYSIGALVAPDASKPFGLLVGQGM